MGLAGDVEGPSLSKINTTPALLPEGQTVVEPWQVPTPVEEALQRVVVPSVGEHAAPQPVVVARVTLF